MLLPLVLLLACVANAQPQQPSVPPQVVQQTRQLLDWLGVLALLDQAPATLALSLDAEAKFLQATPQQREAWRRELEPGLQPAQLQKALIQYVAERYRPATFQRAEELLQQPLAKRARFFDLAMTQATAVQGLKAYRAQLQGAQQTAQQTTQQTTQQTSPQTSPQTMPQTAPQTTPQAARRAIVQELDAASATSLMTATLQTGVAERVRRNADGSANTERAADPQRAQGGDQQAEADGSGSSSGGPVGIDKKSSTAQEFVERQRFLAPLTEDYLLYAYRYFKDEELAALRDLMRDAELQWLLDVSRQGLVAVLKGEGNG